MTDSDEALPSQAETRVETARNTQDTDRKICQIIDSVARNVERAVRRAEKNATAIRQMADQAKSGEVDRHIAASFEKGHRHV